MLASVLHLCSGTSLQIHSGVDTSDWVLWIEVAERKLVWSRAARVPWKQISGEMGCDRTTAWRRWQQALTKIAARLNAQ